jgi:hypothetical protein
MKPTPKLTKQGGVYTFFATGGKGAPNKMLKEVPAERAPRGRTGPSLAQAPGSKAARGGPKMSRSPSLAMPAAPARTAPPRKGR